MTPEPRERPFVSFLTTAFGTESYVPSTIESVLAQTDPDWELVLVDNGRVDTMAAVVEPYLADARIRLVRQENRGYRGGVTAAADAATGVFLSVLDSDDRVLPEFVATMRRYVEAHPDVDAFGCDAEQYDETEQVVLPASYLGTIGVDWRPGPGSSVLEVGDVASGVVPYYTGLVSREAWDGAGGYVAPDPDLEADVMLWFHLVQRYRVRVVPERLAWYRVRRDSLSRSIEKIEAFEHALITTFERAASMSSPEFAAGATAKATHLRYHQELRRARVAFLADDVTTARRHAREAMRLHPGPRAAAVVASLTVAPGFLRWLHPRKSALTALWHRIRSHRRSGGAGTRTSP